MEAAERADEIKQIEENMAKEEALVARTANSIITRSK